MAIILESARPRMTGPAAAIGYLGGAAMLAGSALRATLRPDAASPSIVRSAIGRVDRLLALGLMPVALVHVGMGSFLAMQAYFGATFVDGIGAVVGVGLVRNLAPMLSGFLLAGLLAARVVPELRRSESTDRARESAGWMAAAILAGPILAAWGSAIGVGIGWMVARNMMGVTWPAFFDLFLEMLWIRDVVGLVVKGAGFGLVAALFACFEGMTHGDATDDDFDTLAKSACRAASLACLAILVLNAGWFLLLYHAGPAFGPTVLVPPGD